MWRFVFVCVFAIYSGFAQSQTREETAEFIRMNKEASWVVFEPKYPDQASHPRYGCYYYFYSKLTVVDFGRLIYPVTVYTKKNGEVGIILNSTVMPEGRGELKTGIIDVNEFKDEIFFQVADPAMGSRVAKAFNHLIELCGGKKVNSELFK